MINKIKIKITGKNPDYFLKELIKKNINIYNLEKKSKSIIIIINYEDYLKILEMKTTYKIKIIKKYGINRIKELIKKYLYYIIFFIIGIIINIILSNIIFEIEVIHPKKEVINLMKQELKDLGIKKYSFKKSNNEINKIKKEILNRQKDKIEWLEIENIGTKYIIKVEERKINKENDKCTSRNIIAKKNAIILEVNGENGEIIKKINDYVGKNEVIISGLIHNKEEVVSKRCAKGVVYGEVWYKIKINIPKKYTTEKITNSKKYGINIKIFDKEININNKYKTYKKEKIFTISSKIIPVTISWTKYLETKIINKIYTKDNVDLKALELAEKEIKKKLKKEEEILSKKVLKKSIKDSKIEIEVFLKVKEDITSYQDISSINIEDLNKKEE